MINPDPGGLFMIRARKCQRCGGILFSEYGLKRGYGYHCFCKQQEEDAARQQMEQDQITFFDDTPTPWD